ncbi:hypothetical protein AB0E55_14235 [Amycolatopsis keratiniphila]|uniref:hypothetical protein n=1 Tax=Amycolatopsis keratiniphila TaxID=129921 RepID=UPI0033E0D72E
MQIVNATEGDAPAIGELIAESFEYLDVARWLIDDRDEWKRIAPRYYEAEVRDAMANGAVYTFPDLSAALVMFNGEAEHEPDSVRQRWLEKTTGPYHNRFARLEKALLERQPSRPHQHGAYVAVRAGERSKGACALLLDHFHRILDERGQDLYCEAASKNLEGFFARHGYTSFGPPVTLDGQDLVHPIWREACRPADGV